MPLRVLICGLAVMALIGCCSNPHGHSGQLVSELNPAEKPALEAAPYKATYALYRWKQPAGRHGAGEVVADEEVERLYLRGLCRHDKVGFERDDKGQLFAVAERRRSLYRTDTIAGTSPRKTEYRGMERILHETGENVVSIAALPFEIVGSVVIVPVLGVTALVFDVLRVSLWQ